MLHNNKVFPELSTLDDLLSHPDQDPLGIKNQFEHFLTANVSYPILLVRDDALHHADNLGKLNALVTELADDETYDISPIAKAYNRPNSYSLGSISDTELREQFVERYSALNDLFESQPLIRLLIPSQQM